jgi:hypothetical protein
MFGVLKRLAGCPVPPEIPEGLRRQAMAEAVRQERELWERIDRKAEAVMAALIVGRTVSVTQDIARQSYDMAQAMEDERAKRRGAK